MRYDTLEEMHDRYAEMMVPGFTVSVLCAGYAFEVKEAQVRLAELVAIDVALAEYYEYRASIGEVTAEPVPRHQLDVERIIELLEA